MGTVRQVTICIMEIVTVMGVDLNRLQDEIIADTVKHPTMKVGNVIAMASGIPKTASIPAGTATPTSP